MKMSHEAHKESGFTLIELIVVCVLISMMLVIAVPSVRNNVFNEPLQAESRRLVGIIEGVRENAIRHHEPFIIFFDLDKGQVWYRKEAELETEQLEFEPIKATLDDSMEIVDVWIKSEGLIDSGTVQLYVTKSGYIDRSIIHLQTDKLVSQSLLIYPFTPLVEIQEGYFESN